MKRPAPNGTLLPPALSPAEVQWQDGRPGPGECGGTYLGVNNEPASPVDQLLLRNRITDRFSSLGHRRHFVIAESRFGDGLNFLSTWQAWRGANPAPHATLHYVATEPAPWARDDLQRALALWPELGQQAQELLGHYPPLVQGVHRLVLDQGRVRLTLAFGETLKALRDLEFVADAWYLDSKCNELTQDTLAREIRRHSGHGTTFATHAATGQLLQALSGAGFVTAQAPDGSAVEMQSGFLDLPGPFAKPANPEPPAADRAIPAVAPESPPLGSSTIDVAVVGAGIAGCLLARNLAERGYRVLLAEQGNTPATGASGNSQGALYVKLPVEYNNQADLALSSLLFAQSYYPANTPAQFHRTGLLMMASSGREQDRQHRFLARNHYPHSIFRAVSAGEASQLTGVPCPAGGLWFPESGWLAPAEVCRHLLDHPLIRFEGQYRVSRLLPSNNRWRLSAEGRQDITASHVVLAAGHESAALDALLGHVGTGRYRFKPIRGQISSVPASSLSASPRAVITGERYLNPPQDGCVVTGATFDLHNDTTEELWSSHEENLAGLSAMLPGLVDQHPHFGQVTGRVAFRCTTHDYQPVAGPLTTSKGRPIDGVWLLTGFGSKGLTWGPLLAEFLADRISGQPEALPASLARRVAPERCLRKADPA
ncbi:FAD-dependent 5-carboxymethylaminomethyl-2-thiouridine(34) oxidoreductase MnmC [uncultured Marinobacter sp.]|uniref:FAD-dependent 5-carboxymethylaminomethyl-2-thiouridine(34) oxidoreductase MnmC n=1 Tax=uncultured Marinobacter sp. TaxID=187379 RepID=UPI0030DD8563